MKRILALLLCLLLCVGTLAACGEPENPTTSTDSSTDGSDVVSGTTDTESEKKPQLYDPEAEHKLIMDDSATKIIVVDLDKGGDSPEEYDIGSSVIWEWNAHYAGSPMQGKTVNIDCTKYRYSAYYKKDVIVFSGSGGWVGIIDYATKELLFYDNPGLGPHSVELMPNGDLVLACSGNSDSANGRLIYYPLSTGATKQSSYVMLNSAHSVCWDPVNEVLWGLGGREINAYQISGYGTKSAKIQKISGMGVSLGNLGYSGGHEMTPKFGEPGKYWVSVSNCILLFDANKESVSNIFTHSGKYNGKSVKGIAYFPDGTMVITAHDQGGTGTYRSSILKFVYLTKSEGKVSSTIVKTADVPHRKGSQTYKLEVFSKDYQ